MARRTSRPSWQWRTRRTSAKRKALLDDIRYRAPPLSFSSRNHFTEAQWLPSNEAKGYLHEETSEIDLESPSATLVLRREQWSRVRGLERLARADIPEGKFSVRYLPLAEARQRAAQIGEKKVIEESTGAFLDRLATYRSWPVVGVALARILDARTRADAVAKGSR